MTIIDAAKKPSPSIPATVELTRPKIAVTRTAPPMPVSPYGASKLSAEAYAFSYARSFALPVLAFRFFNVFGPLQPTSHAYAAVVPAFVSSALAGKSLTVHGDGTQTRDFTYVGTVTSVLIDAIRRRVVDFEPVNLAFGSRVSLLEQIAQREEAV